MSLAANRLRSSRSLCLFLFLALGLAWPCAAQLKMLIPDPLEPERRLEVVAVDKGAYLAYDGYGYYTYGADRFFLAEAESFAEGFLEADRPKGFILERKRQSSFEFEITVKASRVFKDCFVALHLFSQDGGEFLLPFEVGDIQPGPPRRLRISAPISVELNRGLYNYYFFSGGEEIRLASGLRQVGSSN